MLLILYVFFPSDPENGVGVLEVTVDCQLSFLRLLKDNMDKPTFVIFCVFILCPLLLPIGVSSEIPVIVALFRHRRTTATSKNTRFSPSPALSTIGANFRYWFAFSSLTRYFLGTTLSEVKTIRSRAAPCDRSSP